MRRFAISDIHGCAATFEALLDQIGLTTADELYLLGDFIDRGPDSRGVIDRVRRLQNEGYDVHGLLGNHEEMMLGAAKDLGWLENWMDNGGWETLKSFGVSHPRDIPAEYEEWLYSLDFFLGVEEYILVHAGLNFKAAHPLGDPQSLLWIRDWYDEIDYEWLDGRIILHGHTPMDRARIELMHERLDEWRVLNIDCGCVFNRPQSGIGYLCAFEMTDRRLFFQKNLERTT